MDIVDRCFSRMAGWLALSIECLRTEFPYWEAFQSFAVFNVSRNTKMATDCQEREKHFERIATIFDLQVATLKAEYDLVVGMVPPPATVRSASDTAVGSYCGRASCFSAVDHHARKRFAAVEQDVLKLA